MGNSFVLFGVSMETFPRQNWEIGHKKSCFPVGNSNLSMGKIGNVTTPNLGLH